MTGPRRDGGFASRWSQRKAEARGGSAAEPDGPTQPAGAAPAARPGPDPAAEAARASDRASGAGPDTVSGSGAAAPADDRTDAEILADLGLPDPATMSDGDDFAAFMRAGVPARLRRVALRRLWASNPALSALDGMVDYGEDFTDAAVGAGLVETLYKVGKGFLRDDPPEEAAQDPAEEIARDGAEAGAEEPVEARAAAAAPEKEEEEDAPGIAASRRDDEDGRGEDGGAAPAADVIPEPDPALGPPPDPAPDPAPDPGADPADAEPARPARAAKMRFTFD